MTKSVSTSLSPIIPAISPDALFRSVTNLPHHAEYDPLRDLPSGDEKCSLLGGYRVLPEQLAMLAEAIQNLESTDNLVNILSSVETTFTGGTDDPPLLL